MDKNEHIDEFESMFKRAEREPFVFTDVPINSIALVTDGTQEEAHAELASLLKFLPRFQSVSTWHVINGEDYSNVGQLLEAINRHPLDLIVTYRHLQEKSLVPQHSLGVYLDVLTQAIPIPVMVLPGTAAEPVSIDCRVCNRVMVIADHISGDNALINYGARMCSNGGLLWLCHIEDDAVFERYMKAIERIPEIESDQARRLIEGQLLNEATNFIETCLAVLRELEPSIHYHSFVARGHHPYEYRALIDRHDVDLLVTNTKDKDQLAMHGMAYTLSVEFSGVAILLL